MTALRQVLSDSLAVLLRVSACKTTSAHPPETVEESFHPRSYPHPEDQQSRASTDTVTVTTTTTTTTTTITMSLKPHIFKPPSYLQSLFDLTLIEYSNITGKDLITHPFVASLDDISSADTAIDILRKRTRLSNDSQTDDRMALLMGHLESIIHFVALLSPSEALCDHIDPVCPSDLDLDLHAFYMCTLTLTIAVFTLEGYPWRHRCSPCSV
jgi:hypothetical protein